MPLFNKAPHVVAALESVLAQSLPPLEIIVVDDASTDGGAELVRATESCLIRVLTRTKPGPGGYAARNLGIEAAAGDWIAFLDADDLWRRDHLETLARTIATVNDESAGCVYSGFERVYPDRRELRPHPHRNAPANRAIDLDGMLRAWLELDDCPVWTGASAFRRDVLLKAGLFPAGRCVRGGDQDMWLRVMAITRCVYSGEATAEYHRGSVNQVTVLTGTADPPAVIHSIRQMYSSAGPRRRRLLRRVANREFVKFGRYSAGRGVPVFKRFAVELYYPDGLVALAKLGGYAAAGLGIRLLGLRRTTPSEGARFTPTART
jgi:glycosyltransferase involved in cell wall biosynthesis